jgi:hypothetical protein
MYCIEIGTVGGKGERGWGANGGGGEISLQPTRDLSGRESHFVAKEGFQVSRRGVQKQGRDFPNKGELPGGLCHVPPI